MAESQSSPTLGRPQLASEKWQSIGQRLRAPFTASVVSFRLQTDDPNGQGNLLCVPYIDARDVEDRLDEVVGPGNWSFTWEPVVINGKLALVQGTLTIYGVAKSDAGANDKNLKGAVSDAFKRTAVKWGIGRFLYRLPNFWVTAERDRNGKVYKFLTAKQLKSLRDQLAAFLRDHADDLTTIGVTVADDAEDTRDTRDTEEGIESQVNGAGDVGAAHAAPAASSAPTRPAPQPPQPPLVEHDLQLATRNEQLELFRILLGNGVSFDEEAAHYLHQQTGRAIDAARLRAGKSDLTRSEYRAILATLGLGDPDDAPAQSAAQSAQPAQPAQQSANAAKQPARAARAATSPTGAW